MFAFAAGVEAGVEAAAHVDGGRQGGSRGVGGVGWGGVVDWVRGGLDGGHVVAGLVVVRVAV